MKIHRKKTNTVTYFPRIYTENITQRTALYIIGTERLCTKH